MCNEGNFYAVTCKCGHVSKKFYVEVTFPVMADNGCEAAAIAREIPRVKHDHKDCILNVRKIDEDEYWCLSFINNDDPYLTCQSIQQQRNLDMSNRLIEDPHYKEDDEPERKYHCHKNVYEGKRKIRNPHRFIRNYIRFDKEDYDYSFAA